MEILKVKEIEKLRRTINKEVDEKSLSNFYEFEMFVDDLLNEVIETDSEIDYSILFLMRIFWCVMKDLDKEKNGYDVKEWGSVEYYNFFKDNIDKVNLNQKSYRTYFKELVKYMLGDLEVKSNNN